MNASSDRRRVVVVGGSFAGLASALTLRSRLPPSDTITLIDPDGIIGYKPSLVQAALGRRQVTGSFAIELPLHRNGIDFVRARVQQVDPDEGIVRTDTEDLRYDRLVIATGGRPQLNTIPGLAGEFSQNHFIVGSASAADVRLRLRRLFADPGPVVVGSAQNAAYYSAAYELAFGIDAALRNEGIRSRVPITFVTAEPYLGHLGFEQTAGRVHLERFFAAQDIEVRVGRSLVAVRRNTIELESGERLDCKAAFLMPPFSGDVDVWKSPHLTDELGFIPVDRTLRHVRFESIYAAGGAMSFADEVPGLNHHRPPQTGYLALHMGRRAGEYVATSLGCGRPPVSPLPRVLDVRVLDLGAKGLLLVSHGGNHLKHEAVGLPRGVAARLKQASDWYVMNRLRHGQVGWL